MVMVMLPWFTAQRWLGCDNEALARSRFCSKTRKTELVTGSSRADVDAGWHRVKGSWRCVVVCSSQLAASMMMCICIFRRSLSEVRATIVKLAQIDFVDKTVFWNAPMLEKCVK